jgi:hypothetical protein
MDRILRKEFWAKDRDKVWYYGDNLKKEWGMKKYKKIRHHASVPKMFTT